MMLKPDFYIRNEDPAAEDFSQCRLLMELSPSSFSYALLNVRGMRPVALKYFQWQPAKAGPIEEIIKEILAEDEILAYTNPNEVFTVYNFEESNLLPEKFFSRELAKPLTDLVYGDLSTQLILDEKIPWWELHNVYRVPDSLYNLMQGKFFDAKSWHFYSLQLKCHKMFTAKEEPQYMKIFFYSDKIVVLVFKEGLLQLIQRFPYQDSKDILYYLMNCCQQFNMDRETVVLELSGLVERRSAMYDDLHQYFLNIGFDRMEDSIKKTDELMEYPDHFFAGILKMAICV